MIEKYFLKMLAKEVPMDTWIYKESHDPRSRIYHKKYRLTNKITYYDDGKRQRVKYAKKLLYLVDENEDISFIDPDKYVAVPFDDLTELKRFVHTL